MVAKLSIQRHLMKGFIIIPSGPAQPQAGKETGNLSF